MTKQSMIACVTPVYNGGDTIRQSINSLLNQSFKQWISIIVNDGSTDNTRSILEEFQDDERFYILNLENNVGRGEARQIALKKVQELGSKYMCMLDADDLYYSDKLEWQFNYMERNIEIALMSSSIGFTDSTLKLNGVYETYKTYERITLENYSKYIPVPHASSIIRVSEIKDVTFDKKLLRGQDQDFMIRFLYGKTFSFVPRISYLYNREDDFSLNKYKKSQYFNFQAKKKLNFSSWTLFKLDILFKLKLMYVAFLFLFNKQNVYFNKIGRKPTSDEIAKHKVFIDKL